MTTSKACGRAGPQRSTRRTAARCNAPSRLSKSGPLWAQATEPMRLRFCKAAGDISPATRRNRSPTNSGSDRLPISERAAEGALGLSR